MISRDDIERFAAGVGEQIGHYVYVISSKGIPIYIGRGQGDRLFSHLKAARSDVPEEPSEKLSSIRRAWDKFGTVDVYIAASHLSKNEAEAYEALLIAHADRLLKDAGQVGLTNLVAGSNGSDFMAPLRDVNEALQARPANFDEHSHRLLLISFNGQFDRKLRDEYATSVHAHFQSCWKLNLTRAKKADRIVLVAWGLIRSVVVPDAQGWFQCNRDGDSSGYGFRGQVDPALDHWVGQRLPEGLRFGSGNPVRYFPN